MSPIKLTEIWQKWPRAIVQLPMAPHPPCAQCDPGIICIKSIYMEIIWTITITLSTILTATLDPSLFFVACVIESIQLKHHTTNNVSHKWAKKQMDQLYERNKMQNGEVTW